MASWTWVRYDARSLVAARIYLLDILELQRHPQAAALFHTLQRARSDDAVMAALVWAYLQGLDLRESPRIKLRVLNHWDNLDRYVERGILQFNALSELMKVQPFDRYGSPSEIATRHFGGVRGMKDAVSRLQTALYQ